jgi:hypothetical protein
MKLGGSVNTYSLVKSVAEELRGLAIESNTAVWSATQSTRDGYGSSDLDLTNTSQSIGLPETVDFMFAMISGEELEALNQIMIKQLKSRYDDMNKCKRFVVGVDKSKMRLYDVEQSAQNNIQDQNQAKARQRGDDLNAHDEGAWKERKKQMGFDDFKF